MKPIWQELLRALETLLEARGIEAWLVGGSVRDALLGRPIRDVDLAVGGDEQALDEVVAALPDELRRGVGRLRHDTVRVALEASDDERDLHLDLSRLHGSTIAQDLANRDFTINAMALPMAGWQALFSGEQSTAALVQQLTDPLAGLADLCASRLRLASPEAFADDPGRILRAARFIAGLGMTPTAETAEAARQRASEIERLHPGRVHEELNALFALPELAAGARWLREVGALEHLPVLPPTSERAAPAEGELDVLERSLALAAQLHPDAPSQSGTLAPLATLLARREWYAQRLSVIYPRFVALTWSLLAVALLPHCAHESDETGRDRVTDIRLLLLVPGGEIHSIAAAVARHLDAAARLLAADAPSLADLRRYFALTPGDEEAGVDTLVVVAIRSVAAADLGHLSDAEAVAIVARAAEIMAAFLADETRYVPPPLLSGRELLTIIPILPGPEIGRILRDLRSAQLDERITTREEAVALARELAAQGADTA